MDRTGREWKSKVLPRYARMTPQAKALIAGTYLAGTYLAGTNTQRVRWALAALFKGAIGKDAVSHIWRKVRRIGKPGRNARSPRKTSSG